MSKLIIPTTELQAISNFSFLRGASHPEDLVKTAARLGYTSIAIADYNSIAGIIRAYKAARDVGIRLVVGARLILINHVQILAYPVNRTGYGNLCKILTRGKRRSEKGITRIFINDILENLDGLALTFIPPCYYSDSIANSTYDRDLDLSFKQTVDAICKHSISTEYFSVAITNSFTNNYEHKMRISEAFGAIFRLPLMVVNDIQFHISDRSPLHNILCCIREKTSIDKVGYRLAQNSERYLKAPKEIARIYAIYPDALRRAEYIAKLTEGFSLSELRYEYPLEVCPDDEPPITYLTKLVEMGMRERFPKGVPERVRFNLLSELRLIEELKYEKYFLTCYDIVQFARSKGILCQGRGAAANSAVCYALGITAVDPSRIDLLFARFISKERQEPPDIDIDFEHERREEVIQYIYTKYGRDRAGLVSEVITYRHRSAVRDIGKALGLSENKVDVLAKRIHRWLGSKLSFQDIKEVGLSKEFRKINLLIQLTEQLIGFPRHLGQHVGGFVISKEPLYETVPISNARMEQRTIIEWDKDDIEELGILKIDVLALGMLSCIRKALTKISAYRTAIGDAPIELYQIPAEDKKTYDMICQADTVGVFQIESRAQMSMLPRLKPRCFYDLVIEVAIVRPGPIQGDMVHPYLRRRSGKERVNFPDEKVRQILGKTLGVPLFQEQAMRLAIVLANFTPGEAEQLRRAISAWKRNKELIATFERRVIHGMVNSGYSAQFAAACMQQIKGFSEYGFPESHAASFALLVYASAWIKCHYPAEFTAALLNSQPMGFYQPAQLIADLTHYGGTRGDRAQLPDRVSLKEDPAIEPRSASMNITCNNRSLINIMPVDINYSDWDCEVKYHDNGSQALQLGLRLVNGLGQSQAQLISQAVKRKLSVTGKLYSSIQELWRDIVHLGVRRGSLEALARADAFKSLNLSRREALWEIQSLPQKATPLDLRLKDVTCRNRNRQILLPLASKKEELFKDYLSTGFSLKGHPLTLIRESLSKNGAITTSELKEHVSNINQANSKNKAKLAIAGLIVIKQKPSTAKGMVFLTIEDEFGIANLIIKPDIYESYRSIILHSRIIYAEGSPDGSTHAAYLNVERAISLDKLLIAA